MHEITEDKFVESLEQEKSMMMKYHAKSLKALMARKEESIYSIFLDHNEDKIVSKASLTDNDRLDTRYDYFAICMEALDLEEKIQREVEDNLKDADKLKLDYDRLNKELNLFLFHRETMEALIDKKKLKVSLNVNDSMADEESIKERMEYYHLRNEAIGIRREIDAKKLLINNFEEHFERTVKEIRKIEESEMQDLIQEIKDMNLTGSDKAKSIEWIAKYESHSVVGMDVRFNFYQGLSNFIAQIKGE